MQGHRHTRAVQCGLGAWACRFEKATVGALHLAAVMQTSALDSFSVRMPLPRRKAGKQNVGELVGLRGGGGGLARF